MRTFGWNFLRHYYEVHVPRAEAGHVLDTLLATAEAAGQEVTLAGMEAMESLALEAGYRHWPSDISQVGRSLCVLVLQKLPSEANPKVCNHGYYRFHI